MGSCCSKQTSTRRIPRGKDDTAAGRDDTPNTKATSLMVADSPAPEPAFVVEESHKNSSSSSEEEDTTKPTDSESTADPSTVTDVRHQSSSSAVSTKKYHHSKTSGKQPRRRTPRSEPIAPISVVKLSTSAEFNNSQPKEASEKSLAKFRNFKEQPSKRKHRKAKDEKKASALWNDFESIQQKVVMQYEMSDQTSRDTVRSAAANKRTATSSSTPLRSNNGKPPLTPNRKNESFDLKGTESWFVDFRSPGAAAGDTQSVRSQANLSLLSENSLDVQRQLYAEKRSARRRNNNTSSYNNSVLMDLLHNNTSNSVTAAPATPDYGPVRRRMGGSSVHQHPTTHTSSNNNNNTSMDDAPTPLEVDMADGASSVVSDLEVEDDDDDSCLVLTSPYDHDVVVQRRLDIEEQLRKLQEPAELDDDDVALHADSKKGVTSVSLFAGALGDENHHDDGDSHTHTTMSTTSAGKRSRHHVARQLSTQFGELDVGAAAARVSRKQQHYGNDDDDNDSQRPVIIVTEPSKTQETLLLAGRVEEHVQTVLERYRAAAPV